MNNFINESYCDMKEHLLYKGIKYTWNLICIKKELNGNNLLNEILNEDVNINLNTSKDDFSKLLIPLKNLIEKKDQVEDKLGSLVTHKPISGQNMGKILLLPLKLLIPSHLIGGTVNKKKLIFSLQKAFKFGYKDVFPLDLLTSGITLSKIAWLKNIRNADKKVIILKLFKWLWNVVKRLVASKYYVTECQGNHSQLIYIPKKTWQSQSDAAFNQYVISKTLSPLSGSEIETHTKVKAPSKLRWLPKKCGLRPIIFTRDEKNQENVIVCKAFLKDILKKTYSGMSIKILHNSWTKLVKKCQSEDIHHLYFVSVDIHDAYGSIIQDKMLRIVEERVASLFGGFDPKQIVYFQKVWINKKPVVTCCDLTSLLVTSRQKKIPMALSELMNTIKNAVKFQTIKKELTFYLMKKGIPQAMPLSAALCNIYLSDLDRTQLAEFFNDQYGCLLRAVDDYLYITADKDKATRFLEIMSNGFKEYGLYINQSKTQTNLNGDLEEIMYYGFLINTVNWEVYYNYRESNVPFRNLLTYPRPTPPLTILQDKMKRVSGFRVTKLTTDLVYMSEPGVMRNVFETACLMACIFKAIVNTFCLHDTDPDTLMLIVTGVINTIAYKVARLTAPSGIPKEETCWVMFKAFVLCLTQSEPSGVFELVLYQMLSLEEQARTKVRLGKLRRLDTHFSQIPNHFRTGY